MNPNTSLKSNNIRQCGILKYNRSLRPDIVVVDGRKKEGKVIYFIIPRDASINDKKNGK